MKTVNRISALLIVLFFSIVFFRPTTSAAQNFQVSFQVFYDNLDPYGSWVYDPNYGYVWVPDEGPDFMPYATNGHWVFTEYGWTWISDYPWGWAPFHYGRWYFDPVYGYIWVPGSEWGPAWVTWRRANGYYGWAPLGPDVNINIAISNSYRVPYDRWIFVRERYLMRPDIYRYHVDRHDNVTIINNSTVINNTYIDNSRNITYISGPDKREIQNRTGRNIRTVQVRDANTPGTRVANDQVQIYRPRVEKRAGDNKRISPARVENYRDIRPVNERRGDTRVQNKQVANERVNERAGNDRMTRKDVNSAEKSIRQEPRASGQENTQMRHEPQSLKQENTKMREEPRSSRQANTQHGVQQQRLDERRKEDMRLERQRQDVIRQEQVRQDRQQDMKRQEVRRQEQSRDNNLRQQERGQQMELKREQPSKSEVRKQNRESRDATRQQNAPKSGRNDRK